MDHIDRSSGSAAGVGEDVILGSLARVSEMMITPSRIIAVFFSVAVFAPLLWMLMDRDPPYEFTQAEITPASVEPGGQIYITFSVKENRPACGPGLVYREFKELVSGRLYTYDPVMKAAAPVIVDGKFTRVTVLPSNIASGLIEYRSAACYTCNPVHWFLRWPVCNKTPPVTFSVAEQPK